MPDEPKTQETLAELFARDPFGYSIQDIERLVAHYREARAHFVTTGKPLKETKPVDLKDLGIL